MFNVVFDNKINDTSLLRCMNGDTFYYIDYDYNIPNATVYDNHIFRNHNYVLGKLIWDLTDIFNEYSEFILHKFKLSVNTHNGTITKDMLDFKKYSFKSSLTDYDKKRKLLDFLKEEVCENIFDSTVVLCKIVLKKPIYYRKKWNPTIPIITEKRTPRVEIKYKKNVKNFSGTAKQHILSRDNKTCQHCGRSIGDGVKLHIDHIIPKSKGGYGDVWNGQVLCDLCNREKHNNEKLGIDRDKLHELKEYYNIVGELKKVRGRFSYYDSDGNVVGRFSRKDIKHFG